MSLSENAWLFSPNIGKYGEFLISNPAPDASKWIDFGGRDFNKYKFKIMLWGPDGPVEGENVKPIDKNNNTIVIARETKSGNIEYLKNVVDDNDNGFVWLSNEKWEVIFKWRIEWAEEKLEVNLNNREPPVALEGEVEMLQKYVLIENKQIAISVGDKINGLTKKIKWKNQYSAIKDAIDQGFYPCLDFAWVAENNGFAEFYDDNYRNNSGENTLTRCWFVMENEKNNRIIFVL